jgi:mono/diheme cytochrome c family protein
VRIAPFGDFPTANLTSDKATGLGNWTDDEIKRAITRGIRRNGTRLLPFPMDYASLSTLTPDDLDAMVKYLRTIPPIVNKVPEPSWTSLPLYLWGKFSWLILGNDPPMVFFPATREMRDEAIPEVDGARPVVVAGLGLCAFLYNIPPFFLVSPEDFGKQMALAAPPVTNIPDPALRAIAERGRYIVMTSGCIGCHAVGTAQGPDLTKYLAGGAIKIHTPRATFVARNLTPDKETGLGRRSDDEIKRVMRSGVFADGHVVDATAMPWGSFSSWTEEERHAVPGLFATPSADSPLHT